MYAESGQHSQKVSVCYQNITESRLKHFQVLFIRNYFAKVSGQNLKYFRSYGLCQTARTINQRISIKRGWIYILLI